MSNEYNPYSAPAAVVADQGSDLHDVASKGRRFGTLLLDYFFYYVVVFLIGIVVGLTRGSPGMSPLQWQVLAFVVLIAYYLFFESLWQRTPGKFLLGTVVINEQGDKPSFGQVLGRTLCRFIPFEPFSFLGREGWHDSISRTKVVMLRKA
jgi:uncharacterized RDD family membrane protein YckC